MEDRLLRSLKHSLGPTIMTALEAPDVVEILVNSDGCLWVDRFGQGMERAGVMNPVDASRVISLVASALEQTVGRDSTYVEGELPLDGSRFTGVMPPSVGQPSFSIRRKASKVFTLQDYVEDQILPPGYRAVIEAGVLKRKNILIVGGTGSGKTTLANAVLHCVSSSCPEDRIVIIEDTSELQCSSPNHESLHTSQTMTIRDLVRLTMRLRPDRIVVGEVRGGEALDLLKSWNTGHPGGLCTVHANNVQGGLLRLEQLIAEASTSPMPSLIGEAVDLVVFIERTRSGRAVSEVATVKGYDATSQKYLLEYVDA